MRKEFQVRGLEAKEHLLFQVLIQLASVLGIDARSILVWHRDVKAPARLVVGGWDIFPDSVYQAALKAGVLAPEVLEPVRETLEAIKPMPGVFDSAFLKNLDGTYIKRGATKFDRFYVGGGATYTYRSELWGRPNNLIAGIDIDRQDDDRQRYNNDMGVLGTLLSDQNELVTNVGLFLQNEMALTEKFALTLGLRYDDIEYEVKDNFLADGDDSAIRTLDEVSPMIGVVYSPFDSTNFYATISTAFETPTTTELANPSGAGGFNPDLQPQLATNYEVGVRGTLAERNRYELSLFSIDVRDELIAFEVGGRDIYENAGKSTRNGIEFSFTSEPVDGLRIMLAYAYSDFVFDEFLDDRGNNYAGNRIPGIPENVIRAEVAYTHSSGFYGVVDARNVGEFFANNANSVVVSSSTVVNLRTGLADWRVGNWRLEPFVGVNNLTDESYFSEIRINAFGGRYYEPAPVRHFYGGLSIRYDFDRRQR